MNLNLFLFFLFLLSFVNKNLEHFTLLHSISSLPLRYCLCQSSMQPGSIHTACDALACCVQSIHLVLPCWRSCVSRNLPTFALCLVTKIFLLPWTKKPTGTFSLCIELKQRLTWYGRCALTVPYQEEEAHDQQQGHGADRHSFRDHVGDIIVHGVQHFQEHLVITGLRRTKFKAL